MQTDRRIHDNLRVMVDKACKGLMPHIADRIKDTARRAYYLGCADGMTLERQKTEEENRNEDHDTTDCARARASAGN